MRKQETAFFRIVFSPGVYDDLCQKEQQVFRSVMSVFMKIDMESMADENSTSIYVGHARGLRNK